MGRENWNAVIGTVRRTRRIALAIEKHRSEPCAFSKTLLHSCRVMVRRLKHLAGRSARVPRDDLDLGIPRKLKLVIAARSELQLGCVGNLQRSRNLRRYRVDGKLLGRIQTQAAHYMQAIAQEVGRLLNISIASPTFAALSGSARNMIV